MSAAKILSANAIEGTAQSRPQEWPEDRLIEARGIFADVAHHPDTLVLLACKVICAHSLDPLERVEALGLMKLLAASTPSASSTCGGGTS